jgi:D-tyrosyl-tRNA(Tyr) deacylase
LLQFHAGNRGLIILLQRVSEARVVVDAEIIARIGRGILALVGVQADDDSANALRQLERLLNYRLFADDAGKMNLSLREVQGGLLLVPQFTLTANTRKGRRPSFAAAASPAQGEAIFGALVTAARAAYPVVEVGRFAADMQVHLINDGPVSFILD